MSDIPPIPETQTPAYKAAKVAVIILSVLIILAVIGLIVGGITRLSKASRQTGPVSIFQLQRGSRIIEMHSEPGRLILRIRNGSSEEIDLFDTQDGHLIGQIKESVADGKLQH